MGQLRDKMEADLLVRGMRPNTRATYLGCVYRYVAYHRRSPEQMGTEEVNQFLQHLANKAKPATLYIYVAAIRFFYEVTLVRPEVTSKVAWPRVPRRVPQVLSGTEVQRLLNALQSVRQRMLASLMYGAGLRVSEACSLRIQDIDSERMVLHIHEGKGGTSRYAPLSTKLLAQLRSYYRLTRPKGIYLFPGRSENKTISTRATNQALSKAAASLGFRKGVSPHTLRHSFATHLLELGTDLRTIQTWLGHSSLSTTVLYAQVRRGHMERQVLPLDVLGTPKGKLLG